MDPGPNDTKTRRYIAGCINARNARYDATSIKETYVIGRRTLSRHNLDFRAESGHVADGVVNLFATISFTNSPHHYHITHIHMLLVNIKMYLSRFFDTGLAQDFGETYS